jgi:hypothetical protein
LEATKKALSSENSELVKQVSQLKSELQAGKLAYEKKVGELQAQLEAQSKDYALLEVQERKR